jgi:hypothetical protein
LFGEGEEILERGFALLLLTLPLPLPREGGKGDRFEAKKMGTILPVFFSFTS